MDEEEGDADEEEHEEVVTTFTLPCVLCPPFLRLSAPITRWHRPPSR